VPNIEPSYLRYVHDQLAAGAISPENAAALPQGFIGLYEQEFSQKISIDKRQHLLNHLATWALFKGPVSAAFASNILMVSEGEVKDFIDRYSSWFNSPESGKYQLYHERLRVFILQKLNDKKIHALNEQIISYLESAVNQADDSEDEKYALQFLHNHMALESMLGIDYERLHNYVNQKSLWERQIKVSKGYEWSQNAVQQGMKEGARRNHEMNTIRSTVNSVKLMTQEQNSAEAIIDLLNEGDYHSALKRAESWEGDRQFKLYLLFIHELTIGTSKEASFRKEACKAVLEAIDQTPEDHSILDWTHFYPVLAIYRYYNEFLKIDLDCTTILKRGSYCGEEVIGNKDLEAMCMVLLDIKIPNDYDKSKTYLTLVKILITKGEMIESMRIASEIPNDYDKSKAYGIISEKLIEVGEQNEALQLASKIILLRIKSEAYANLAKIMKEQGDYSGFEFAMNTALKIASEMPDDSLKSLAYVDICEILIKIGEKEKSIRIASELLTGDNQSRCYALISEFYLEQGEKEQALQLASEISRLDLKSEAHASLSKIMKEQGDNSGSEFAMNTALKIASEISEDYLRTIAYNHICKILIKIGETEKFIQIASEIPNDYYKSEAYGIISEKLIEEGEKEQALQLISEISRLGIKSKAYANLAKIMKEQGDNSGYEYAMNTALKIASEMPDDISSSVYLTISENLIACNDLVRMKLSLVNSLGFSLKMLPRLNSRNADLIIAEKLIERGEKAKALQIASINSHVYPVIFKRLLAQGERDQVLRIASEIPNDYDKSEAYATISEIFNKNGDNAESEITINEALHIAEEIRSLNKKISAYFTISKVFRKKGDNEAAKSVIRTISSISIDSDSTRDWFYQYLSEELMELKEKNESILIASKISDLVRRNWAYSNLSQILIRQGDKAGAFRIASEISNDQFGDKPLAYALIAKHLNQQFDKEGAQSAMKDAVRLIAEIPDDYKKSRMRQAIAKIMIEQGDLEKAFSLISKIDWVSVRLQCLKEIGGFYQFQKFENVLKFFSQDAERTMLLHGFSEKFLESNEEMPEVLYYLHDYSRLTSTLSNILFYKAKRACFFEEERNEEKLDILSEVLDIEDWRRVSASFSNN